MSVALPIIIILLLIVANGLFVAAEFAIVASKKPRIATFVNEGVPRSKQVSEVIKDAESKDRYVAAAQLGITLASIGLGMYGERSIAGWLYGPLEHYAQFPEVTAHIIGTIIAVAILTYFHVVFGEMIPKALALQSPERTALGVSRAMGVFSRILAPAIWVLNGIGTFFLKLMGVPAAGHGNVYSVTELEQLVEESFEEGQMAERQRELIENIFSFGERTARQVMTPRTRVVGLSSELSGTELLAFIDKHPYSRYPVYKNDLDHIVGILHVKDIIHAWSEGQDLSVERLLHRVARVPEATAAETLLDALKRRKVHMAVVMNEYGGTAGIVTLEDLLEEVVGDVQDEYDNEEALIQELEAGRYLLQGELLLDEFNDSFDLELISKTSETVAGLVVDALNRPPVQGDTVTLGGAQFEVTEVEGLAIRRLELRYTAPQDEEDEPES